MDTLIGWDQAKRLRFILRLSLIQTRL